MIIFLSKQAPVAFGERIKPVAFSRCLVGFIFGFVRFQFRKEFGIANRKDFLRGVNNDTNPIGRENTNILYRFGNRFLRGLGLRGGEKNAEDNNGGEGGSKFHFGHHFRSSRQVKAGRVEKLDVYTAMIADSVGH